MQSGNWKVLWNTKSLINTCEYVYFLVNLQAAGLSEGSIYYDINLEKQTNFVKKNIKQNKSKDKTFLHFGLKKKFE